MRIVVYHGYYGCDTGCCGHVIELDDQELWAFSHPNEGETLREFVERNIPEKHRATIDWSAAIIDGELRDGACFEWGSPGFVAASKR